jgi:hypothetical protein
VCRAFALLGSFGDTPRHRAMSADGDEVRRTTERCIVLVGAVGAGKSSVGNALASGQNPFTARRSASGVTSTSSGAACAGPGLGGVAIVDGNETWWVIDTPGLSDGNETKPGSSDDEVLGEIVRCCASSDHRLNPTFGIDIFALVFNASGRVTAGDLRVVEDLKLTFGAGRFLERCVVVFTHADVLRSDGCDLEAYLSQCPEAMRTLLSKIGGGEPVFADLAGVNSAKGINSRSLKTTGSLSPFVVDLATAVRRADAAVANSCLRSVGIDPADKRRVVAADVIAAAQARAPKLGMKAARRQRQEVNKKRRETQDATQGGGDWVGDLGAWVSNLIAPIAPVEKTVDDCL